MHVFIYVYKNNLVHPDPNLAPNSRHIPPKNADGMETPWAVAKESEARAENSPPKIADPTYTTWWEERY